MSNERVSGIASDAAVVGASAVSVRLLVATVRSENDETIGRVVQDSVRKSAELRKKREAERAERREEEARAQRAAEYAKAEAASLEASRAERAAQEAEAQRRRDEQKADVESGRASISVFGVDTAA